MPSELNGQRTGRFSHLSLILQGSNSLTMSDNWTFYLPLLRTELGLVSNNKQDTFLFDDEDTKANTSYIAGGKSIVLVTP